MFVCSFLWLWCLWLVWHLGTTGFIEWSAKCLLLLYFLEEFVKDWCFFLLKCLIEFTSVVILAWIFFFFLWVVFLKSYQFNIFTCYKSIEIFFLLESVLVVLSFLRICSFHLGYLTFWYMIVHSFLIILFISIRSVGMSPLSYSSNLSLLDF